MPGCEKCGFGADNESVRYEVHKVTATEPAGDFTITPRTVKDAALRFAAAAGRVDVGLKGPGRDPKGVFWDSRGNSFAVAAPSPSQEGDARVVSDQGVVLCSINGIGEVRWTVHRGDARYDENAEAVAHFGLTWGDYR